MPLVISVTVRTNLGSGLMLASRQKALFIAQAIDTVAYRWQWQLGRLLRTQGNIPGAILKHTEAVNNLKSLPRSDFGRHQSRRPVLSG